MERFFRKSFSYFIIIVVTYYTTVFFVIDDICIQRETKLELLGNRRAKWRVGQEVLGNCLDVSAERDPEGVEFNGKYPSHG